MLHQALLDSTVRYLTTWSTDDLTELFMEIAVNGHFRKFKEAVDRVAEGLTDIENDC